MKARESLPGSTLIKGTVASPSCSTSLVDAPKSRLPGLIEPHLFEQVQRQLQTSSALSLVEPAVRTGSVSRMT
jgi:hypothetical protein